MNAELTDYAAEVYLDFGLHGRYALVRFAAHSSSIGLCTTSFLDVHHLLVFLLKTLFNTVVAPFNFFFYLMSVFYDVQMDQ